MEQHKTLGTSFLISAFTSMLKLNIADLPPIQKCFPMTKIAYILASARGDEDMVQKFNLEIFGYGDKEIPEYRYVTKKDGERIPVKMGIIEIRKTFEQERQRLMASKKICGRQITLLELQALVERYDFATLQYVAKTISESIKESSQMPSFDAGDIEIPDELKEFFG